MAEYYINHIRELQPNGPYLFAGFSFGGLVALEMAHRFLRDGEDVALLSFLDTVPHPQFLPLSLLLAYWRRRIYEHAAVLAQLPPLKAGPYVLKRLPGIRYAIRARYFAGRQSASDPALPEVIRGALDGAVRARRLYHPRFYPGTITLLKAEKTYGPWQAAYATFWAGMAVELDVHIVPGGHMDMVTTHAESLGAQLSLCIKESWVRNITVALP